MSADQTAPAAGEITLSAEQFAALQEQIAGLTARVDQLEADLTKVSPSARPDPEVILAISAAVAAFLGKRAKVKQVRLRQLSSWSAQGRTTLQQSHSVGPSLTRS